MQVLEQSPSRLHLRSNGDLTYHLVIGMLFIAIFVVLAPFILYAAAEILLCDPVSPGDPPACQIEVVSLMERPRQVIPIHPPALADLVTTQRWGRRRPQTAYQIVLVTETGQARDLGYAAFNQSAQRRRVEAINQYLSGDRSRPLRVGTDPPITPRWVYGGLLLMIGMVGLACLMDLVTQDCRVERRLRHLVILRRNWLGQTEATEYGLSQIDRVVVDRHHGKGSSCRSRIYLKSGEVVTFIHNATCREQRQVVEAINQYIQDWL